MIKILLYGLLSTGAVGALAICKPCGAADARSLQAGAISTASVALPKTVTLRVDGMTCGGCVVGVRKVLTRLEGVTKAEVSYEDSRAVVTFDSDKVTVDQMIAAINKLGYKATVVAT